MQEKLKEIKQSFRLYMNGVTAQSLRDKGVNYHLNWGVSLQHLQEMAAEIKADLTDAPSGELLTPPLGEAGRGSLFTLSSLLWKENIRECKILATMLMPADTFPADLAMLWVEQTPTAAHCPAIRNGTTARLLHNGTPAVNKDGTQR